MNRRGLRASGRLAVGLILLAAAAWPRRAGVAAEPATDKAAILQRLLDGGAKRSGLRVDLPAGEIACTATIRFPNQEGGVVAGRGAAQPIGYVHPLQAVATRLVWAGPRPATEPLLLYAGAETAFRDLCLDGATRAQIDAGEPKGGVGLLMTKQAEGLGVGGVLADNLFLSYWQTALQIGDDPQMHNCERSTWRKLRFNRCDTAVRVVNIQGMGHYFYDPEFQAVDVCFLFEGGGKFAVHNPLLLNPSTFLKFAPPEDGMIGPNNAGYYVTGLIADEMAHDAVLVDMKPGYGYWADIVFEKCHISWEQYAKPAFNVSGATSLTLRDCYGVQRRWFRWDNPGVHESRILVENCRILGKIDAAQLFDVAGSRGKCRVIVRDCYDESTGAVANYAKTLVGQADPPAD